MNKAADDVRARFEASYLQRYPNAQEWMFDKDAAGTYYHEHTHQQWLGYRAAHADLSGEVRELVEADRAYDEAQKAYGDSLMKDAGVTQRAWNRLGKAFERRATALAKFTQEKNDVLP